MKPLRPLKPSPSVRSRPHDWTGWLAGDQSLASNTERRDVHETRGRTKKGKEGGAGVVVQESCRAVQSRTVQQAERGYPGCTEECRVQSAVQDARRCAGEPEEGIPRAIQEMGRHRHRRRPTESAHRPRPRPRPSSMHRRIQDREAGRQARQPRGRKKKP